MNIKIKALLVYLFTLGGIIVWLGLIFLTPYLKDRSPEFSNLLYRIFSPTCHQIPSRCFTFFGYPLAVCARCLGIYVGFLTGTCAYPFLRNLSSPSLPKTRMFISLSVPIVIDFIGNFFHIWASSNCLRFITGIIWGIILPFYFITGITDCFKIGNVTLKKGA